MIKSPLRYPGGKSRAIKTISQIVPAFQEYREPFLGGGSLFVYLKQFFPSKKFWINDLYQNLYYFWNECQQNPERLLDNIIYFRSLFQDGKELHRYLLDSIDSFTPCQKAAAFFVFNRITFSGTTESGGFSNAAYHNRFTESSIQRVKELSGILSNTTITNLDYEELINHHGDDVFIFLDPPYYSAEKSALYGKNGSLHKGFNHYRFAEVIKKCPHKWLITYDDSKYVRELFSFANIQKWNLKYGMRNVTDNSDQNGNELFISNYELNRSEQIDFLQLASLNKT